MTADKVSLLFRYELRRRALDVDDKWHLIIMYFSFYHEKLNTKEEMLMHEISHMIEAIHKFDNTIPLD